MRLEYPFVVHLLFRFSYSLGFVVYSIYPYKFFLTRIPGLPNHEWECGRSQSNFERTRSNFFNGFHAKKRMHISHSFVPRIGID